MYILGGCKLHTRNRYNGRAYRNGCFVFRDGGNKSRYGDKIYRNNAQNFELVRKALNSRRNMRSFGFFDTKRFVRSFPASLYGAFLNSYRRVYLFGRLVLDTSHSKGRYFDASRRQKNIQVFEENKNYEIKKYPQAFEDIFIIFAFSYASAVALI